MKNKSMIFKRVMLFSIMVFDGFGSINFCNAKIGDDAAKILSRRRRYVTFPEGSSFSCAACTTLGLIGDVAPKTVPGTFTWGVNWGIAYELPNETVTVNALKKLKGIRRPVVMRRNRRELYGKLETIMRAMGYDGRECMLKTLCETTQRLVPRGVNVVEEIFRTIFTQPRSTISSYEPPEHVLYDTAYRNGRSRTDCNLLYRRCPLSLVDLLKGFYDVPAEEREGINMMSMYKDLFM